MPSSNEQLWQGERVSRRRIVKGATIALLLFLTFLGFLSLWVTQPLLQKRDIGNPLDRADASKLQKHVQTLSQTLYPRNYLNTQNLDRTADYIRNEFEKTGGRVSEQTFNV